MNRYQELNDAHKRAEEEKRRQEEERARQAEAAQAERAAAAQREAERRNYDELRQTEARQIAEKEEAKRREETLRLAQEARDGMNTIFGEEARALAREHEADPSRSPMLAQAPDADALARPQQQIQGGHLEPTPDGTRFHPARPNTAARQAEQAPQQELDERPQSLARGNEISERALSREAQESGKEKTAAQLEREAKIAEFMQQMRQGRELEQERGRERGME